MCGGNRQDMTFKDILSYSRLIGLALLLALSLELIATGKPFAQNRNGTQANGTIATGTNNGNFQEENPPSPQLEHSPYEGAAEGEKRHIEITLDNMDIYPVLDYILGGILQLNFAVDPAVKGTISVKIKGDFTRPELLNLLNSILQIHGLAITVDSQGLYKVLRKDSSGKVGTTEIMSKPDTRGPNANGDVIRVFQLKYLSASHVVSNLRNFISPGAVLTAEPSVNAVILVDTLENCKKVQSLLSLMDTSLFKDISWRFFSLDYTDADDMARDLDKIFNAQGLYLRQGMDKGAFQILPLKTVNAVLVVTKWPELLDIVGNWIRELDQGQQEKGSRVYVYFVQNGNAKDLADLLQQLYQKSSRESSTKKILVSRRKESKKPGNAAAGELTGEVEIIPDENNNALIIKATPKDYATISKVLRQIDIVPRQVLIDVLIVDVALNNDFKYGVEWYIKNKTSAGSYYGNLGVASGIVLRPENGTPLPPPIGEGAAGFAYTLYNGVGDLRALLFTIAEKTDVNILSAPNILAVDNQESTIEVGDDVPTLTGTTTTTGGTVTQSVQYRNAGIILKVKPSINNNGMVRMEVTQEVSAVTDEKTGNIDSPRFRTRKATTHIVAQDGQTILIGGLMQSQKTQGSTGVPILKDIPIIGYLFGGWYKSYEKTELLIAITPHVIKSRQEADALTKEFSERVKSIKQMLEESPLTGKEHEVLDQGKDERPKDKAEE